MDVFQIVLGTCQVPSFTNFVCTARKGRKGIQEQKLTLDTNPGIRLLISSISLLKVITVGLIFCRSKYSVGIIGAAPIYAL